MHMAQIVTAVSRRFSRILTKIMLNNDGIGFSGKKVPKMILIHLFPSLLVQLLFLTEILMHLNKFRTPYVFDKYMFQALIRANEASLKY